jgi:HD-like signal output (HDOD) protein/ActR/RegA family two-component response regulator
MTRILFVDDEQHVLQGLKRMLYGMRNVWTLSFAGSGEEALGMLAKDKYDVIVSDMRMPGMDGAQLLNEVRMRYPQVMRIVLSGHAKQESIMPSVGLAHQYLSKPCSSDQIKSTIARACALRDLLADPTLQGLTAHIGSLPTLPSLHAEVLHELQSETCSTARIGEIVSKDVSMTAKLLQLVNSSFFGLPLRVSTAADAVRFLGIETVRSLVMSFHCFDSYARRVPQGFSMRDLWKHSVSAGFFARKVVRAETSDERLMNDACTAGLLHDAGKMVLAAGLPDRYAEAMKLSANEGCELWQAEREIFGSSHAEVGAYLLGLWGLPDPIVEAVAFHHRPMDCVSSEFGALTAVHVAEALEHSKPGSDLAVDMEYLERIGLSHRLEAWQNAPEPNQSWRPPSAA